MIKSDSATSYGAHWRQERQPKLMKPELVTAHEVQAAAKSAQAIEQRQPVAELPAE